MVSLDDNSALLLFRVGPVLCCAPSQPVSAIIVPPTLTHPPGSRPGHPGIFRHANHIVKVLDLRHQFGLEASAWNQPGRSIVTKLDKHHLGFHVDEIQDVIKIPTSGWSTLPPLLPSGIFSRTLLYRDNIYLYAEFAALQHIPHSGYLRQYIEHLNQAATEAANTRPGNQTRETPAAPGSPTPSQSKRVQTASAPAANPVPAPISKPATGNVPGKDTRTPGGTPAETHTPAPVSALRLRPPAPAPKPATPASIQTTHHSPASAHTRVVPPARQVDRPPPSAQQPGRNATTVDEQQPSFTLAIILFAVLGVIAAGLWYSLAGTDSLDSTPPVAEPASPANRAQTDRAIAPDNKPEATANPESEQASKSASPDDNTTAPALSAAHSDRTAQTANTHSANTRVDQHKAPPSPHTDDYHASITKAKGEITITVDEPPAQASHDATTNTQASAPPATAEKLPVSKATPDQASAPEEPGVTAAPPPQTRVIIHIVVKGDTLWAIASKYIHDPFRYPELARLSKIRNPDLIYPGERVRIIKRIH